VIVAVEVGVALGRPPRLDRLSRVLVEADSEVEGRLVATQMAACQPGVAMPVWSAVVDVLEL
jgi:hypothetical protein